MAIGDRIGLPDDVSVGYVIGNGIVVYNFLNLYYYYDNLSYAFILFSQNICWKYNWLQ